MHGCSRAYLQAYLDEFCWRNNFRQDKDEALQQLFRAITQHFPLDGDKRIDWSDKFFNARDAEIEAKNEEEEEEEDDDDDEINQSELDELIKDLNRTVISTPLETQQQPSFELSTQPAESTPLETQQQPSSDVISKQQNESNQGETQQQPSREERYRTYCQKRHELNESERKELEVFREKLAQIDQEKAKEKSFQPLMRCDRCDTKVANYKG